MSYTERMSKDIMTGLSPASWLLCSVARECKHLLASFVTRPGDPVPAKAVTITGVNQTKSAKKKYHPGMVFFLGGLDRI